MVHSSLRHIAHTRSCHEFPFSVALRFRFLGLYLDVVSYTPRVGRTQAQPLFFVLE